jgi:hypothetical protein
VRQAKALSQSSSRIRVSQMSGSFSRSGACSGWKDSFFGTLHDQSGHSVEF